MKVFMFGVILSIRKREKKEKIHCYINIFSRVLENIKFKLSERHKNICHEQKRLENILAFLLREGIDRVVSDSPKCHRCQEITIEL